MVDSFVMQIPKSIAERICRRTPEEVYREMIEKNCVHINDILAFGVVRTPIYFGEIHSDERFAGYVTLWWNHNVVSTDKQGVVLGVDVGRGYVTVEEAVEIFEKHFLAMGGRYE